MFKYRQLLTDRLEELAKLVTRENGKTLDEALDIKNTQIAEELALPPVKIHCSILAEDAIKAAISDYQQKQGKAGKAWGWAAVLAFTLAPLASSSSTTAWFPRAAARWRGSRRTRSPATTATPITCAASCRARWRRSARRP